MMLVTTGTQCLRGLRVLIFQFCHRLAMDLWESLYEEKPASATIQLPLWLAWERCGISIVLGCLSPLASLYHSYHLDIPVSAFQFHSVQSLSRVRLFVTPRTTVYQAPLSISNSRSLLKLMFIELVMPTTQLLRPNLSSE